MLPVALTFMAWEDEPTPKSGKSVRSGPNRNDKTKIECVGLSTGQELIRIRVRETPMHNSPSCANHFPYQYQLDLNDLTDAALSLLPPDAFSLLLTAEHDLYESIEDDFCCGRAWGSSRVAIVSSARYNPALDRLHGVDPEHVWPASHCAAFVESINLVQADESAPDLRTDRTAVKRGKTSGAANKTLVSSTPLEQCRPSPSICETSKRIGSSLGVSAESVPHSITRTGALLWARPLRVQGVRHASHVFRG